MPRSYTHTLSGCTSCIGDAFTDRRCRRSTPPSITELGDSESVNVSVSLATAKSAFAPAAITETLGTMDESNVGELGMSGMFERNRYATALEVDLNRILRDISGVAIGGKRRYCLVSSWGS